MSRIDDFITYSNDYITLKERETSNLSTRKLLQEVREGKIYPTKKISETYRKIAPLVSDADWPAVRESIIKLMIMENQIFAPSFSLRESDSRTRLIENYFRTALLEGRAYKRREGESDDDYNKRERARKDHANTLARERYAKQKAANRGLPPGFESNNDGQMELDFTGGGEQNAPVDNNQSDAKRQLLHTANQRYRASFTNQFGIDDPMDANLTPEQIDLALKSVISRANQEQDTEFVKQASALLDQERSNGTQAAEKAINNNTAIPPVTEETVEEVAEVVNEIAADPSIPESTPQPPPTEQDVKQFLAGLEGEDDRTTGQKVAGWLKRFGKAGGRTLLQMGKAAIGGAAMGALGGLVTTGGLGSGAMAAAGAGGAAGGIAPIANCLARAQGHIEDAVKMAGNGKKQLLDFVKKNTARWGDLVPYLTQVVTGVKMKPSQGGIRSALGSFFGTNKKPKTDIIEESFKDIYLQARLQEASKKEVMFDSLDKAQAAFDQSRSGFVKVLSVLGGIGGAKAGQLLYNQFPAWANQLQNASKNPAAAEQKGPTTGSDANTANREIAKGIESAGPKQNSDGSTTFPDGVKQFPDGSYIKDGVRYDKAGWSEPGMTRSSQGNPDGRIKLSGYEKYNDANYQNQVAGYNQRNAPKVVPENAQLAGGENNSGGIVEPVGESGEFGQSRGLGNQITDSNQPVSPTKNLGIARSAEQRQGASLQQIGRSGGMAGRPEQIVQQNRSIENLLGDGNMHNQQSAQNMQKLQSLMQQNPNLPGVSSDMNGNTVLTVNTPASIKTLKQVVPELNQPGVSISTTGGINRITLPNDPNQYVWNNNQLQKVTW